MVLIAQTERCVHRVLGIPTDQLQARTRRREYELWRKHMKDLLRRLSICNIPVRSLGSSSAHVSTRDHSIKRGFAGQRAWFEIKINIAARDLLLKTLFAPSLISCLRYQLFLTSKITILQAILKENIPLTTAEKKCFFRFPSFFVLDQFSVDLQYSCFTAYTANVNSEKENTVRGIFAGIRIYSRGIVGLTGQRTAFTRAHSAILQSRSFTLRVERREKISYSGG